MAGKKADTSGGAERPAQLSFEAQLDRLEQIVGELEAGARPLDESLKLYEDGVAALRACHSMLDQAEKRIRVLVESRTGELSLKDVRVPEGSPAAAPAKASGGSGEDSDAEDDEGEEEDGDEEGGREDTEDDGASPENSARQPIDSPPSKRENPSPNPVRRPRSPGAPSPKAGGGSLFGRPE